MSYKIFDYDPSLLPYESEINLRMNNYYKKKAELVGEDGRLVDFANGHHFFGFHKAENGWFYREWAPAADDIYLFGDFNGWNRRSHRWKNLVYTLRPGLPTRPLRGQNSSASPLPGFAARRV